VTNLEKIELYLANEMKAAEKAAFEQELTENKDLKETYLLYVSIENTMKQDIDTDKVSFQKIINEQQQKHFSSNKQFKKQTPIRKLLFIGLSAAAIIAIMFTFFPKSSSIKKSNDELYAYYAKIDTVDEVTRGNNDSLFNIAAQLFNQKKYAESAKLFENIQSNNAQVQFILGIAYTEIKQFDKAVTYFDEVLKGNSVFKEKAYWHKAMVYLKKNDTEKCKQQLKSINKEAEYYDEAQKLLKEMK
jgi:tetratricopeptide (TPR) repeat protein